VTTSPLQQPDVPWAPSTFVPPAPAPSLESEVTAGVGTTLLVALLGAPVGLLWAAIAPKVDLVVTADGVDPNSYWTKEFVAADAWFLIIGMLVGALCGVLAWQLSRRHQLAAVFGLTVGGLLAALIAWRVGHLVDVSRLSTTLASLNGRLPVDPTLDLRAKGVLFAWPFAAVASFLLLISLRPNR
jgi:uncharacterized membrane protein YeaQ/YmgE (transglycosylase-associated protein family)